MTGFVDRMDLGFFPLQDHVNDGTPVSARRGIAGGRIVRDPDPEESEGALVEYGRENGMGTLGDVHPWTFWQTRDRGVRGSGAWAQAFGALVVDADGRYAVADLQPIRDREVRNDARFAQKRPGWPACFPSLAKGAVTIAAAGTEESEQHDVAYYADPRLVAPNVSGPGRAGTIVVDLQPSDELCMDGSSEPGIGGRHARLQSLVRVIAAPENEGLAGLGSAGNVLALNHAHSGTDGIPGLGAIFARVTGGGGPTTGGGTTNAPRGGPTTGPRNVTALLDGRAIGGDTDIGPGAFGLGALDSSTDDELAPRDFGAFESRKQHGHGVALTAAIVGFGPVHAGDENDKHQHGRDRDGHAVNAAHIATTAYFFRDRNFDGPLHFEAIYPNPPGWPMIARTHLSYDPQALHRFGDGTRPGLWRWWTEVPFFAPTSPPGPPTPPVQRPPITQPPGRGNPPPPAPPPPPPTTQPPGGGAPAPPTPAPPRPPTTGPRGGGPGGGPGGSGGPTTPASGGPRTVGPSGLPTPTTGPRGKNWPPGGTGGPQDPNDPQDPGGGSEPQDPPGGICTEPADAGNGDPHDVSAVGPTRSAILGRGSVATSAHAIGGPGGTGTPARNPMLPLGRYSGLDSWTRRPELVPGLVERVGGATVESRGLYEIFHPMRESFASLGFRPQLTRRGYPNFEHNPQIPYDAIDLDERVRPQVLSMRAWGAQSDATGDWDYVEDPMDSRARGGTAHGGVLFAPPRFELEDYYGLQGIDVEDTTSERATQGYVLAAPGVAFALGKPAADGTLQAGGVTIGQDPTQPTAPVVLAQNGVGMLRLHVDSSDVRVELRRHPQSSWAAVSPIVDQVELRSGGQRAGATDTYRGEQRSVGRRIVFGGYRV